MPSLCCQCARWRPTGRKRFLVVLPVRACDGSFGHFKPHTRAHAAVACIAEKRTDERSCQTESKGTNSRSCQTGGRSTTDEGREGKGEGKTNTTPSRHGGASEMATESASASTDMRRRSQPEDRVFIIGGGQRFHNQNCGMVRANIRRVRGVSRREAIQAGFTNCQQCGG